MNLVEKTDWVNTHKGETELAGYRPYTVQDIMLFINKKFADKINDHMVLQKIIDSQFDGYTKITYRVLLTMYVATFCVPFVLQIT